MKSKIKSIISVTALLFLSTASFAQKNTFAIGARGGINISRLCCGSMVLNEDYKFGEGPSFGLIASYGISKHFSIAAELDMATQGGKKNGMQAITPGTNGSVLYANFDNKTVLNYLELPILARVTFGEKFKYYINAGPYVGYLLSARNVTSGNSLLYSDIAGTQSESNSIQSFESDKKVKDQFATINYGLTGGVGAGYAFDNHGIWLDGRYVLGIPNIRKNTSVNGENSTGSIMVGIMYTYSFN